MLKEGQIRIPSGCAISGMLCRSGRRISGESIIKSIAVMHDRSNGLGGGFAGYGIYPEYKDYFALHVFYDTIEAREKCERFLDKHFDIINLSKIPTRKLPEITNEPLIWRYFVTPLPTKLAESQLELDGSGYIVADETTKTSVPGVFAVGDVRTKPLRQVVTAVADGAMAVHMAEEYLAGGA